MIRNQPRVTANRFLDKLNGLIAGGRLPLCVGLDPDPNHKPSRYADLLTWNRAVIEQTSHLAACYKPNIAFYEALGRSGFDLLQLTLNSIPPEIPIILDAKRGDISSTAEAYARACFEVWDVDAVTLNPYLGADAIHPFTRYGDRYVFVLCHTSNYSAGQIQSSGRDKTPLYHRVAELAPSWGDGNVGLVVGATYPDILAEVRALAPDCWFLAPGVGAQGGNANLALHSGARKDGQGVLINVARGIAQADDHRKAAHFYVQSMESEVTLPCSPTIAPELQRIANRLYDLGCIRFGDFVLASGLYSPIYIDLRLLFGDPTTLAWIARVYAQHIAGLQTDRIAGVPLAALPIATAVSLETKIPLIYPRRQTKSHGRSQLIEGAYQPGERVIVIEDLATTAGSMMRNIETIRQEGLEVTDAIVLIDREQGGTQNLDGMGVRLHALFSLSQILNLLHDTHRIDTKQLRTVQDYLAQS